MADTEQDPGPGEKEANKPPSPKPDQEGEVAPPLVSVPKGMLKLFQIANSCPPSIFFLFLSTYLFIYVNYALINV